MMVGLPRYITALIDDDVLTDPDISATLLEQSWWETDIFPLDEVEWLKALLKQQPGLWTARICRTKHDIPETRQGISYCGLCLEYANPRKRARSAALGPELPGFEGQGAFRLHPPCSRRALTWLRHILTRWANAGIVHKAPKSVIPDIKQPRGWDYATRIYWLKGA